MAKTQSRQSTSSPSSSALRLRGLVLLAVLALLIAGAVRLMVGRAQPPPVQQAPAMDDSAAELPSSPPPPPPLDLSRLRALHASTLVPLPASDVPAHLQAAQTARQLGDLFTAQRLLEAALKQDPHSVPVREMLAEVLRQLSSFAEARRLSLELHTEQPHELDPFVGLAETAEAEGKHDEVFAWLAKAHTDITPTVVNLINLAHHYQDWHDFVTAKAVAAEALRLAPGNEDAMLQDASILVEHGEMEEAQPLLEDLVAKYPQNGYACRLLAVVLANPSAPHQDFNRARILLEKAAEINPSDVAIYRVAAVVYRQQHLYRLAAGCYDALLKLDPTSLDGRFGLGQVYALLGKADWSREQLTIYTQLQARERQIPTLNMAIHHHPTDPRYHEDKAHYLELQGDLTGALAEYEITAQMTPASKRGSAINAVRRCYTQLGWPPYSEGNP